MTIQISILVADDHDLARNDLRRAIAVDSQLKIIAETEDRTATEEGLRKFRPEVAILDLHMPERSGQIETKPVGYDLLRFIVRQQLPTRAIFLTGDWHGEMLAVAFKLGVKGYVLKNHAAEEIVRAVKTVAAGGDYVSPQINAQRQRHAQLVSAFVEEHKGLLRLTPRQLEVLKLLTQGKASAEIAAELGINSHSVDNHRTEICGELWLKGPHALSKFVLKYKVELLQFFAEL